MIRVSTNAGRIGAAVRERAAALEPAVAHALEVTGNDLLRVLRKRSSGTMTYAEMRALDHPYARRHGTAKVDPSIINLHRGVFKRAWKIRKLTGGRSAGGQTVQVVNDSKAARYMRGTKYMVYRPVVREAIKDVRPAHERRMERAVKAALGGRAGVFRQIGRAMSKADGRER